MTLYRIETPGVELLLQFMADTEGSLVVPGMGPGKTLLLNTAQLRAIVSKLTHEAARKLVAHITPLGEPGEDEYSSLRSALPSSRKDRPVRYVNRAARRAAARRA